MTDNTSSREEIPSIVERGYDGVAEEYAQLESGEPWPRMRWLSKLLEQLEAGSSILDLGCGSGDPTDSVIAENHQVTGVDVSGVQIKLARQNIPSGVFIHEDVTRVDFLPASFDAVVSFYTLEHIPREKHSELFKRISRWLRQEGLLLISTEASEVDGIAEWLGTPMFFSSYGPDAVIDMVKEAGFEILQSSIEVQEEGPSAIPYLWVFARK